MSLSRTAVTVMRICCVIGTAWAFALSLDLSRALMQMFREFYQPDDREQEILIDEAAEFVGEQTSR